MLFIQIPFGMLAECQIFFIAAGVYIRCPMGIPIYQINDNGFQTNKVQTNGISGLS